MANIDFATPNLKRKRSVCSGDNDVVSNKKVVRAPAAAELDSFYSQLAVVGKPVILSLTPGYSEPYIPLYCKGVLPKPLTSFFDIKSIELTYPELLTKCEDFFNSYTITPAQLTAVEVNTRDQSNSKIWFDQRSGRVTASKFRQACCTSLAQPAQSLIKAICYPKSASFKSAATSWGCEHEEHAGTGYKDVMSKKHVNFSMSKSGFIIPDSYPLMGASPDGIISCECCGRGVLEIKCPYSCRDTTIVERTNDLAFFMRQNDGDILLDVYHAYYFQVQVQLKFANAAYDDFVVWNNDDLVVQRLYPDEPFISIQLEKCQEFIKIAVLPEVLGKWYSREPSPVRIDDTDPDDAEETWCYCGMAQYGEMIECEGDCTMKWFHLDCVRITTIPSGRWFCPDCRKKPKYKSKRKN